MPDDAPPTTPATDPQPRLSVVVLQWDNLALTRACVESLRAHTDVPYELVLVDNGSADEAVEWAQEAADVAVCNGQNLGFGGGMNAGLEAARGEFVAFVNNDTEFPPDWASRLLETASTPGTGLVVPAVTQAGNKRTVRQEPGEEVELLSPFLAIPAGVVMLLPTDVCRALGGFGADEFPIASGEDLDLAFKVWTNDLEILFDQRVVVDHVGHATANAKLDDRPALWKANREIFFDKWLDRASPVPRLPGLSDERYERNRLVAAEAVALRKAWMDTKLDLADTRKDLRATRRELKQCREQAAARTPAPPPAARTTTPRLARRVGQRLPTPVTRALLPLVRRARAWRRR